MSVTDRRIWSERGKLLTCLSLPSHLPSLPQYSKDDNASLSTRASAAKDAAGDKVDETKVSNGGERA